MPTRGTQTIAVEPSVRCEHRIDDRSPGCSRSHPGDPTALAALVRLLARQSAREWLATAAFEEPTHVDDEAEAGAAQPPSCG